jgi:hypothetical protein
LNHILTKDPLQSIVNLCSSHVSIHLLNLVNDLLDKFEIIFFRFLKYPRVTGSKAENIKVAVFRQTL